MNFDPISNISFFRQLLFYYATHEQEEIFCDHSMIRNIYSFTYSFQLVFVLINMTDEGLSIF